MKAFTGSPPLPALSSLGGKRGEETGRRFDFLKEGRCALSWRHFLQSAEVGENALLKIVGGTTRRGVWFSAMLLCVIGSERLHTSEPGGSDIVATYSIVAYDPHTKEWGVAVQSKFFGVGSVVPWAKAGVGAIATQAQANVRYGPHGLQLLEEGKTARQTLQELTHDDASREVRQVGIVDAKGRAAAHTGTNCNAWAGHIVGTNFTVQGNILAGEAVVKEMARAFEEARTNQVGELADWMLAALEAAERAGGDTRGRQSASMLVVRQGGGISRANDRYIDIRVEDHKEPIEELGRLLSIHKEFFSSAHKRKALFKAKKPKTRAALALAK
jgi:uncharacterized Ntn-hydrolase superfamily protein